MMARIHRVRPALAALVLSTAFAPQKGQAQALSPMKQMVMSFADSFAVRVHPSNPYDKPIRITMRAYDAGFRPVEARFSRNEFTLPRGGSLPINVIVSFEGRAERKVRICAESVPHPNQKTLIKAQICGKFFGRRVAY